MKLRCWAYLLGFLAFWPSWSYGFDQTMPGVASTVLARFGSVMGGRGSDMSLDVTVQAPPAVIESISQVDVPGQETLRYLRVFGASHDCPEGYPVLPYVVLRLVVPFPRGAVHEGFQVDQWVKVTPVPGTDQWDSFDGMDDLPLTLTRKRPSGALDAGRAPEPNTGEQRGAVHARWGPHGGSFDPQPQVRGRPFYGDLELTIVLWLGRVQGASEKVSTGVQMLRERRYRLVVAHAAPAATVIEPAEWSPHEVDGVTDLASTAIQHCTAQVVFTMGAGFQDPVMDPTTLQGEVRFYDLRGTARNAEDVTLSERLISGSDLLLRYDVVPPIKGVLSGTSGEAVTPMVAQLVVRDSKGRMILTQPFGMLVRRTEPGNVDKNMTSEPLVGGFTSSVNAKDVPVH